MQSPTPPLPVGAVPPPRLPLEEDLPATEAHRVLLYCALDAAGVPKQLRDEAAVTTIAELDYQSVEVVISWLENVSGGDAW